MALADKLRSVRSSERTAAAEAKDVFVYNPVTTNDKSRGRFFPPVALAAIRNLERDGDKF
jgi:hypothetical protein